MKKTILLVSLPVAAALFVAAFYTSDSVAQDMAGYGSPGTRCTRLQWSKVSKKEIEAYKAKKVQPGQPAPGTRCGRMYTKRTSKILPNVPPVIGSLRPQNVLGAPDSVWSVPASGKLTFGTVATDPDGDTMLYTYSVTGGRVTGDGPIVDWDLSGAAPGTYTISTEVDDGCGCITFKSASAVVGAEAGDALENTTLVGRHLRLSLWQRRQPSGRF